MADGIAFPDGRGRTVVVVSNPIQPLIENLSAYPSWLVAACILIVSIGVLAFFFRVFRYVIVIALVLVGLVLASFVAIQLSD